MKANIMTYNGNDEGSKFSTNREVDEDYGLTVVVESKQDYIVIKVDPQGKIKVLSQQA